MMVVVVGTPIVSDSAVLERVVVENYVMHIGIVACRSSNADNGAASCNPVHVLKSEISESAMMRVAVTIPRYFDHAVSSIPSDPIQIFNNEMRRVVKSERNVRERRSVIPVAMYPNRGNVSPLQAG